MSFNRRVDHSRRGSNKSSIRSTRGYIILNNHDKGTNDINETGTKGMTKNTCIDPSIESTQYIAAGADTTHCNIKSYTCVSDIQTDQKNTEDCLKRFQQEYNELLKRRKEEESSQCPSKNNVIETRAYSTTYEKCIESSIADSNSCSLDELSACNLIVLNSNNTLEKNEMNSMNSSIFSIPNYVEQIRDNSSMCEKFQHKMKKRSNQYRKHHVNNVNKQKHEKYREKVNRRSYDAEKMCMQMNRQNENIQKQQKGDNAKFHGMLDGLNNEIIKIKELFMSNKENNSCCNHDNNITNRCDEMCAGEDLIEDVSWESNEPKTDVVKKSTNHKHNRQFKQQVNTNQINQECRNHNRKFGSTNEEIEYSEDNSEEHTADGFYVDKPSDRKIVEYESTDNIGKIVNYYSLQNPDVCQCGMIFNKN